jgi:nucleoside-diphosphate kinase
MNRIIVLIFALVVSFSPQIFAKNSKQGTQPMAIERTLSIVKPDAVAANHIGEIIASFEKQGLRVIAAKMLLLTKQEAQEFYAVHKARPFYNDLVTFMTTGPVLAMVLEGEGAIPKNREIMGATNPAQAAPGTIRARFAKSIEANAVHGSDSPETAKTEIQFFFSAVEICPRTQ